MGKSYVLFDCTVKGAQSGQYIRPISPFDVATATAYNYYDNIIIILIYVASSAVAAAADPPVSLPWSCTPIRYGLLYNYYYNLLLLLLLYCVIQTYYYMIYYFPFFSSPIQIYYNILYNI